MTFSVTWFIGQFQGVIRPQTPIGSWMMYSPGASSRSGCSKRNSLRARMNALIWPSPAAACAFWDSVIGAPISLEIAAAISSARRL